MVIAYDGTILPEEQHITVSAVDPRSQAIIHRIEAIDPRFVFHLPSSTLKHIINHVLERPNTAAYPIPIEQ